ncbi:tetratricopeptide repeat protein [Ohtaekwangia sp.]|uniref:tetratricopeptide repeat protein n=1 Tax=Ohtaekwangia sp. TaxID=2066019 RepID=UPI002F92F87D
MTHKTLSLLLLCVAMPLCGWAQTDSLQAALDTAKNQYRVKALNEMFRKYHENDPAKAVGYAREALNLATEINDKKGLAAAYNNLGIAYKTQGALDKALEYYLTSLRTYESLNNKEGIATTKNNIATIYSMKRDFGQAMKYLEDSYTLFVEMKDEDKIIRSMNNLGNLHSEIQLYEKAMNYFQQAAQLSEKKGSLYADPLMNMGNLYFRQNNYQRAVEQYEKALELERKNNNKLGALNILVNMGITYTKAKQPKPAQVYLTEALTLCDELQAYSFQPAIYKTQAENYSNEGKWKEAYESFARYDEVREKIYGEESSRNIAQMEMIMEFQQKEKEYDMLKQQDEITQLELRNSRLFIVLFILAGLIILGGLNFYFSKKKIRRKI